MFVGRGPKFTRRSLQVSGQSAKAPLVVLIALDPSSAPMLYIHCGGSDGIADWPLSGIISHGLDSTARTVLRCGGTGGGSRGRGTTAAPPVPAVPSPDPTEWNAVDARDAAAGPDGSAAAALRDGLPLNSPVSTKSLIAAASAAAEAMPLVSAVRVCLSPLESTYPPAAISSSRSANSVTTCAGTGASAAAPSVRTVRIRIPNHTRIAPPTAGPGPRLTAERTTRDHQLLPLPTLNMHVDSAHSTHAPQNMRTGPMSGSSTHIYM